MARTEIARCAEFSRRFIEKDNARKRALQASERAEAEIKRLEFQIESLRRRAGNPPPVSAPSPGMPGRRRRRDVAVALGEVLAPAVYLQRRISAELKIREYNARFHQLRLESSAASTVAEDLKTEIDGLRVRNDAAGCEPLF